GGVLAFRAKTTRRLGFGCQTRSKLTDALTPRPKEYLAADSRENAIPVLLFEPTPDHVVVQIVSLQFSRGGSDEKSLLPLDACAAGLLPAYRTLSRKWRRGNPEATGTRHHLSGTRVRQEEPKHSATRE